MEDSFKVRVDRAFGSLEAATASSPIKSTSSSSSSLWCLTDQEIQRNEWIQLHKEDKHPKPPKPPSSFFHPNLEEEEDQQQPLEGNSNDEWNTLRSSLGMDCTLDNEEEVDAFDKVALGEEEEERFYMRDVNVNDYEVEIDSISNNELPNSFTEAFRDPRANLMAAKLRLKQDDESAASAIPIQKDDSVVPDYVRNPSKYTHYTFDSMDELDEESNKKAYMELLNSVKRKDESMDDVDDDVSSTSIVFTPRNKSSDDGLINKNKVNLQKKKVVPKISVAAEVESEEVCVMEEDEPEIASNKTTGGRKYRTKTVE